MSTDGPTVSEMSLGLGGPTSSQVSSTTQAPGQHSDCSYAESSVEESPDDSGYSSFNEEDPDPVLLNEQEVKETGCRPVFWSVDQPFPDFSLLGWTDALRLCRELGLDKRGHPSKNFSVESPYWDFRCAFAEFHREAIRDFRDNA